MSDASREPADPDPAYDTWVPEAALNAMREERDKARRETTYWADQYELISRDRNDWVTLALSYSQSLETLRQRLAERDASLRHVARL